MGHSTLHRWLTWTHPRGGGGVQGEGGGARHPHSRKYSGSGYVTVKFQSRDTVTMHSGWRLFLKGGQIGISAQNKPRREVRVREQRGNVQAALEVHQEICVQGELWKRPEGRGREGEGCVAPCDHLTRGSWEISTQLQDKSTVLGS